MTSTVFLTVALLFVVNSIGADPDEVLNLFRHAGPPRHVQDTRPKPQPRSNPDPPPQTPKQPDVAHEQPPPPTQPTQNQPPPVTPCRKLTPSERFRACCDRHPSLGPKCRDLCHYDKMKKDVMFRAYLRRECTGDGLAGLLACLNRHGDQRPCCSERGVYPICVDYCASTQTPARGMELKYLKCTEEKQFNTMVSCFKDFDEANRECINGAIMG